MRKLGSIEAMNEFILAIAGGADVNATWRGSRLVEYYFTEAMREILLHIVPPAYTLSDEQESNTLKLQAIIAANADVSPLFHSSFTFYEYSNLVRLLTFRLEILKNMVSSAQGREEMENDLVLRENMADLYKRTQMLEETIKGMVLGDGSRL